MNLSDARRGRLGLSRTWRLLLAAIIAGATVRAQLAGSPANPAGDRASEDLPPLERKVSLAGGPRALRDALTDICRQVGLSFKPDEEALAAAGLQLDERVSPALAGEPLKEALGRLARWRAHPGVCHELRGDALVLTTVQAIQDRTSRHLPEWLKPLQGRGLLASIDGSGAVTALTAGDVMTDELLARLESLPGLRELDLSGTRALTKRGLAHLGGLRALEVLRLHGVNDEGDGLGDAAIESASRIPILRELSIGECGTTDDGVRNLEAIPLLRRLELRQEGRLTDAALGSIAKLRGLRHLDLSSYVGTASYGRMRFSPEGLLQLASLRELEVLWLPGQAPAADLFPLPKLTALSLGAVGDDAAARIAGCRGLRRLELLDSAVTDDGLKSLATLANLRELSLTSRIITDAGMAHLRALPRLEHLDLRATAVGDETLGYLAEIKTLTHLDLNGTGLPGSGVAWRFSAQGLRQLKRLPGLRTLRLTNLRVSGATDALAELVQLRVLSLTMTDLTADELAALEHALPDVEVTAMTGAGRLAPAR
ncbi:Leucine Rich repeats (2 copies) [Aquisphaera giovannonii]|uniref:Leucine Rich repeats (2 copies) n=1 Tax=Aquisphaera giovannonii TaxID=406548 RepID=A0A5B9WF41_9BACT|nr:hypothetical protein [Aquisphaera giovannonii]QEH38571.1 Leucine Rich repeats (2 copies) [Aquisphaera giovannonii]